MILVGRRKTRKVMKLRVMLTAISVLNVIFNVTWFICIVIHYLVNLEEGTLIDDLDKEFSQIVWEIFGHQCVDSLLAVQSVFLLSLSMDRYLNLFIDYSPYIGGCSLCLAQVLSLPDYVAFFFPISFHLSFY
ncbi:unnamed protein product, partial [Mesorhabditis belari]|uniref:Uncharacterized protein n=1 Tax=Mesorhabditis belari TaxID=2138241 RepID=A0AAF3ETW5_9BILA